ncbi:ATP-dependent helicase [Kocuria sp.]|uniref:ATP-dependent helicase n=1 Tax=Kocuria sp. TaxID=1871328 RepID=UPI0026DFE48D|nr:ATP-dependent DNA helicase [Kocuria sp.]MDO5617151.1 ATP-dependent DNA helicase [Kocuria sp.]
MTEQGLQEGGMVNHLDAEQRTIADLKSGCGPVMVWGAPGTGRTTAVLALAARRLAAGMSSENLLVLTPSRASAARFRDQLAATAGATISTPPVRAWQAYAFDLLRRAHLRGLLPGVENPPKLLSGPEQDVLIRELMDGQARGLGAAVVWPPSLGEAVATRGFRAEIRELFDRMSEHDISPDQLRQLGKELGRPEWAVAARFREEYQAVRRLRMPETFDPAALVTEAARVLENHPEFLAEEQQRLELVIVDDLQEATRSIHRLLRVLCAGQDLVATACPDTVVQGFRGARPEALRDAVHSLGRDQQPMASVVLRHNHRMGAPVHRAWQRVAQRIPAVTAHNLRVAPTDGTEDGCQVQATVLASTTHEARWIGADILRRHLLEGQSLEGVAVIVRNSAMLRGLQRQLESLGIPVTTAAAETPIRDEPAVRPILAALRLVVAAELAERVAAQHPEVGEAGARGELPETTDHPGQSVEQDEPSSQRAHDVLEAAQAVELLTSRIGAATAMDIRRLRQRLRYAEIRDGGGRNSDRLLVEALIRPGALETAGVRSTPATRVARMLQAGRHALTQPNATAETVLWALWEAAGVASTWQKTALAGGEAGRRADRDLDAVVGLFEMAERFVDHLPGAGAAEFLDFLELQELPMDTLAARAPSLASVEIMTPATAAGRQWPVVYVAGVQEGQWPNTTLRGQLLGTDLLADAAELGTEVAAATSPVTRLNVVRYDELRSFSTAVSRASDCLVVTAVADQDNEPSEFLGLIDPWELTFHPEAGDQARPVLTAPRPLTLPALTAQLRAAAQSPDELRAEAAARILHHFARSQTPVPGADPKDWWGLLELSTQEPVLDPGEPVPVSPSRVETITRSPLDWWVSVARAEAATDTARSLGTLVHAIAEAAPNAPSSELVRELDRRWPELGLPQNWESEHLKQRAELMLRKFAQYAIEARSKHKRELVAVEGSFSVLITGGARDALLRGRVDRLEVDEQGRYVVVDLKTGAADISARTVNEHPQLGTYQVALAAGAGEAMAAQANAESEAESEAQVQAPLEIDVAQPGSAVPGGAVLVQLGTTSVSVSVRTQQPMSEDETWAQELISSAAQLVAGHEFVARHTAENSGAFGRKCRLPGVCPLCSAGRQVTS